ncbi:uncharacterized protein N7459_008614 [Penicillium hispanicum]|uniref:uncharacterized protein n=1 Tax=Penicillium hispanicum TaxID=1080232 RepID=UPI0025409775|nr:uncharacterized protein N7459_008614 [Penicillium hispanicum]KAJ5574187.1 hypothetical protein N7459_008614 [Penicillium hispanicum]
MPLQHRILALVFEGFEALDFFGPLGAIVPRSDYYTLKLVHVHNFIAHQGLETSIKNSIGIIPSMALADALREEFDTLFIPGGVGILPLLWDPMLLQHVGQLADKASNVFSVCTGSLVLAATGRLDGRQATTNKRAYDEMTPKYQQVQWQRRARWVQDGKFLTSSGVTAGLDAGFAFLANTYVAPEDRVAIRDYRSALQDTPENAASIPEYSREKALAHARSVAWFLEYRWQEDPTDDPFV